MFLTRKQLVFRFIHRLIFMFTVMATTTIFYMIMFLIFIAVN